MKITIIGGGIGGLTTAIALQQKGIEVEIFEAASEFREVGAGITLAINSMQIYKRMGMLEKIQSHGNKLDGFQITDNKLNILSYVDISDLEKKYKVGNVAIHRAKLQEVLLNELQACPIHLGKKLIKLHQKDGNVHLEFEDGTFHQTKVLIGADGIHSAVRRSIFPNSKERHAKQICWRGITDFDLGEGYHYIAREAWGIGRRIGIVPIAPGKVYWYACLSYKHSAKEIDNERLSDLFSRFHPLASDIISSTKKENIITAELGDLELIPEWHKGNVCLLGDAAHATTPNMGQGANQAIESAWILSECLKGENDIKKAYAQYQKIRQPKATMVVKKSWGIGKIAHMSNPLLAKIRNLLFSMTPDTLAKKQLKKLFDLND
ncbi:MAG: FAD-dependent monooxygenase [Saprospiraceae bacterium]|nr:FAD-dependent monooxygenase [Saprospiraceae bacterium]